MWRKLLLHMAKSEVVAMSMLLNESVSGSSTCLSTLSLLSCHALTLSQKRHTIV